MKISQAGETYNSEVQTTYDVNGKATVFTSKGADNTWFTPDDVSANWSGVGNSYQYTGQRYDPETELMYYKNRYFDTDLGRFLSRNPIGYVDGLNLYEYVHSSPILNKDHFGLKVTPGQVACNIALGAACLLACPSTGPGAIACGTACAIAVDAICNPTPIDEPEDDECDDEPVECVNTGYILNRAHYDGVTLIGCECLYECSDGSKYKSKGRIYTPPGFPVTNFPQCACD